MSTLRVEDWRPRLVTWAESVRNRPFIWGATDCATLARKALSICFGRDIIPDVPHWRNLYQAKACLEKYGNLPAALEKMGAEVVTLPFARGGDLISMPEPEEPVSGTALGIWIDRFAVMSSAGGVVWVEPGELVLHKPTLHSLWEIPDLGMGLHG